MLCALRPLLRRSSTDSAGMECPYGPSHTRPGRGFSLFMEEPQLCPVNWPPVEPRPGLRSEDRRACICECSPYITMVDFSDPSTECHPLSGHYQEALNEQEPSAIHTQVRLRNSPLSPRFPSLGAVSSEQDSAVRRAFHIPAQHSG